MKTIFNFGLMVILICCAGYTGWYFGHINGFAKAKGQYSGKPYQSQSQIVSTKFASLKNSQTKQDDQAKTLSQLAVEEVKRRSVEQQIAKMNEVMQKEIEKSKQLSERTNQD